jgi:hypothetical protein
MSEDIFDLRDVQEALGPGESSVSCHYNRFKRSFIIRSVLETHSCGRRRNEENAGILIV